MRGGAAVGLLWAVASLSSPACAPLDAPPTTGGDVLGEVHAGQYHLGPVDFAETQWPNACAPEGGYTSSLRQATGLGGAYLAGVSGALSGGGALCDACILITTATGKSIVARVVTYGATNAPGDIDVSPSVYAALDTGEYPRSMTWQLAVCPDTGPLRYEFQTGAHEDWTSFWVRNPRRPVAKVEVKSARHASFFLLRRETDGTLNDDRGFGLGSFELRVTSVDGRTVTDGFAAFTPGGILESTRQLE